MDAAVLRLPTMQHRSGLVKGEVGAGLNSKFAAPTTDVDRKKTETLYIRKKKKITLYI